MRLIGVNIARDLDFFGVVAGNPFCLHSVVQSFTICDQQKQETDHS